jgi:hypothetical protein
LSQAVIKLYYDCTSGALPPTFSLNSASTIQNSTLPAGYSITVNASPPLIQISNSTITTNANSYLLFPKTANVIYATGGASIANWLGSKTWSCTPGIPGGKLITTTSIPPILQLTATLNTNSIYNTGVISGAGDGSTQLLGIIYLSF